MKTKLIVLIALICFSSTSWAAKTDMVEPSSLQAANVYQYRVAQMQRMVDMTVAEYGAMQGKKLNWVEKFSFKLSQHRMKNMLKDFSSRDEPNTLSKISWFFKGLVLGPIALLIGYLLFKDEERELLKWIWFGFAGFVVILTIVLLVL